MKTVENHAEFTQCVNVYPLHLFERELEHKIFRVF